MQNEDFLLPKVFGVTRRWKIVLLFSPLFSLFFGGGSIWLLITSVQGNDPMLVAIYHIFIAVVGIGMTPFLLWCSFDYYKGRLVFTADGLTFYGSGFRMYTPWQNILSMETRYKLPASSISWGPRLVVLKLREAMVKAPLEEGRYQGKAVIEMSWWYPYSIRAPFAGVFVLDEIVRERHWLQGELGAYLFQYAPWVFFTPDFMVQGARDTMKYLPPQ